jgi:hypothetical protein
MQQTLDTFLTGHIVYPEKQGGSCFWESQRGACIVQAGTRQFMLLPEEADARGFIHTYSGKHGFFPAHPTFKTECKEINSG